MKEFLWGRTLTFLRQTFRLSHLFLDLHRYTCVDGSCRLASKLLAWGWCNIWVHGTPQKVHVRGTSNAEKIAISRILDSQHLNRERSSVEVYDPARVIDKKELSRYNNVLREVCAKVSQRFQFIQRMDAKGHNMA
ncbi:hypothetical protein FE257_000747 [Aspergillus nanangensis]|uniref:Uncharacterized protein n=1 Tax=Aspergillus nanangensis TaxID=2582783 RepID=A0AAD4CG95_ASPNN|nr:hypothetical protein FE257_000747 [Aspergillus nanangensis]